ncbi:MAG: hypothetical protein A6D91_05430 [Bacillaceae bacterium G1]|nr:MAG: hypothetical protein A6D91_05430 [Bacillaceae bacterium G1]
MEWIAIQRLVISALLGAMIGWEREHANKQAGLRTHMLVTLGSCLLMLLSIYGFRDWLDHPNARFDPARLAAQVINGIGFLAAGAILVRPDLVVSGLTTAATVWIAMGIGLAVGAGEYVMAVVSTIIVLLVLRVLPKFEVGKRTRGLLYVQVQDRPGVLEEIAEQLGRSLVRVQQVIPGEEQRLELLVQVNRSKTVMSLIEKMRHVEGVTAVYWEGRQVFRQGEEATEED